jgi:hypothetical protein
LHVYGPKGIKEIKKPEGQLPEHINFV